eukprot:m.699081 g.699081  ORF g.699081 m.699081 type:complete len:60 (+) comp22903_c0_seq56:2109-2288(+)
MKHRRALGIEFDLCHTWDAWGLSTLLTVIQLQDSQIIAVRTPDDEGRDVHSLDMQRLMN